MKYYAVTPTYHNFYLVYAIKYLCGNWCLQARKTASTERIMMKQVSIWLQKAEKSKNVANSLSNMKTYLSLQSLTMGRKVFIVQ